MSVSAEASHRTKGLLRLTMACNERCTFCNVPVEDYLPSPTPSDDETQAELDAFIASEAQTLTISGGEPTLFRRRLLGTIRRARSEGIPFVELQTNAILIDDAYAVELAEAGLTSAFVSLLSDKAELHDALTLVKRSHERCLRGIDALLDVGVRVTLNPVFATSTQDRAAAYMRFVAERLPRVRSISLSAVQPHGRASDRPELLPDYGVLGPSIREARAVAEQHGIEVINPYCGLPLCAGWRDGMLTSVEAVEAELGGWKTTPGIDNLGNKRHGAPCERCALRTRCGGAWHDYWALRSGSGLRAPQQVQAPWEGPGSDLEVRFRGTLREHLPAADEARAPVVWLHTPTLTPDDVPALMEGPYTDVAWETDLQARSDLATARALAEANAQRSPQRRIRLWIGMPRTSATTVWDRLAVAAAMGVHAVHLLDAPASWQRLVDAAATAFPGLPVQRVTRQG